MEFASGNIFVRKNLLPKVGDHVNGHTHNFDHTTIVFTGSVHVKAMLPDGTEVEKNFTAPAHFLVKKNVSHLITATIPHTEIWCVYSHRTSQGDIVQECTGWDEAYV